MLDKSVLILCDEPLPFQECPPTMIRIIFRLRTTKRKACQMMFPRKNLVDRVGNGGYDSS